MADTTLGKRVSSVGHDGRFILPDETRRALGLDAQVHELFMTLDHRQRIIVFFSRNHVKTYVSELARNFPHISESDLHYSVLANLERTGIETQSRSRVQIPPALRNKAGISNRILAVEHVIRCEVDGVKECIQYLILVSPEVHIRIDNAIRAAQKDQDPLKAYLTTETVSSLSEGKSRSCSE